MSEKGGRDIVLLDGGMGQELMRRSARPPAPLWSADTLAEEPELVTAVHRDFVAAGARVLTTAGYSVTPGRLAKARREAAFETLQAAALTAAAEARAGAAHPVRIAGCLPPLLASYQPFLAPEPAAALAGYRRLVAAQRPGVDLYLGETLPSIAEARAALDAARESGLPVWIAFTVDDADGRRLRSGEPLAEAAQAIAEAGAEAVLVNCSRPETIGVSVPELVCAGVPFGAYANGFTGVEALRPGLTVAVLEARRDLDPATYAAHALAWVAEGASIVGGCCEVGPAHIAALARALEGAGHRLVSAV